MDNPLLAVLNPDVPNTLRRAFDMQGPAPAVFSPLVQAGVHVVDLEDQQYLWLRRTGSFTVGGTTPTDVLRPSVALLRPVVVPGPMITRVRRVYLSADTVPLVLSIQVLTIDAALPVIQDQVVVVPSPRDSRMVGAQPSTLQLVLGTSVAGAVGSYVLAAATIQLETEYTLVAGGALFISSPTPTFAFNVSIDWEERFPVTSEVR